MLSPLEATKNYLTVGNTYSQDIQHRMPSEIHKETSHMAKMQTTPRLGREDVSESAVERSSISREAAPASDNTITVSVVIEYQWTSNRDLVEGIEVEKVEEQSKSQEDAD